MIALLLLLAAGPSEELERRHRDQETAFAESADREREEARERARRRLDEVFEARRGGSLDELRRAINEEIAAEKRREAERETRVERRRAALLDAQARERGRLPAAAPPKDPAAGPAARAPEPQPDEVSLQYYYGDVWKPFFESDPARPGWLRAARSGASTRPFPARKAPGTLRVFVLGGSTAGGWAGPGDLQWGLERGLPGRPVEVINCGMSGYDGERESLVLRDVLPLEPDAVVFLRGHNDFGINASPPKPAARWAWTRRLARRLARARPPERRADKLHRLLAGVRRDARAVLKAGALPVFVLPPAALELAGPNQSFPWDDAAFVKGWRAWAAGRREEAVRAWKTSKTPHAAAYLARAERLAGRHAEAEKRLLALQDEAEDACGPSCLAAVGQAAREEGALVADADAAFRAHSRPLLPGAEDFVDEIHWDVRRHWLVTRAVMAALPWKAALPSEPAPPSGAQPQQRVKRLFYAVQRIEQRSTLSLRALRWLEAALPSLEPAAAIEAARRARAAFDNRSPGLFSSPEAAKPLPEAALRLYLGVLKLERGDRGGARLIEESGHPEAQAVMKSLRGA